MVDNAVSYFRHLRDQGVAPSTAVEHVEQRYGIDRKVVMERVNGKVADPEATREALAMIRDRLLNDSDAESDEALLHLIYNAVTGEAL